MAVTAVVEHAGACRLEPLSGQSFLVDYPHGPARCEGGWFSAVVRVGANPTAVRQTVTLAVVAGNNGAWYTEPLDVALAPGAAELATWASGAGTPLGGVQVVGVRGLGRALAGPAGPSPCRR